MLRVSAIATAASIAAFLTAEAAELTWLGVTEQYGMNVSMLRLDGQVEEGDANRFRAAAARAAEGIGTWDRLIIQLNSPGGSYPEGLKLAEEFRRRGVATVVASGDYCYSACAIAFLGGSERLRDPEMTDVNDLPDQPPDRSLGEGGELGFHAPYLGIQESVYTAENVQDAYRLAVDSISMLIALADHLFVEPAELPRLLAPGRDEAFMVDNVDALRSLWITYTDYSLQTRDLTSITQSMVTSACVNRWFHGQRRSALQGLEIAWRAASDFEMGSRLLANGETGMSFGVRRIAQGTARSWIAFLPVAMTSDGRNFVWCVFDSGLGNPRVMYREAGTIAQLFEPIKERWDVWAFNSAEGTLLPTNEASLSQELRVLDMVPADTKLADVASTIAAYQASEPSLLELAQ